VPAICALVLAAAAWPALTLTGSDGPPAPSALVLSPAVPEAEAGVLAAPPVDAAPETAVELEAPPAVALREQPVTLPAAATARPTVPKAAAKPVSKTGAPGRASLSRAEPATATPVRWRASKAVGKPFGGRLANSVQLPGEGRDFVTWDSPKQRSPSRGWRRFGTDRLIRVVLKVAAEYRAANPDAPRMVVGDLSRPNGGPFGSDYGGLGHRSHQNGLDVDVFYPRRDRLERPPSRVADIDHALAQDLVDRFVRVGAEYVFVGPHTSLTGRAGVVSKLVYHDDHLHVRIRRG
jgi:hypothetical protein